MIELTCWGCGWAGRVREGYAGQRVTCRRCRAANAVPDRVSEEIEVWEWFRAFGRGARGGPRGIGPWPSSPRRAATPPSDQLCRAIALVWAGQRRFLT